MQHLSGVDGMDCGESWCPEPSWCFLRMELPFEPSPWLSVIDIICREENQGWGDVQIWGTGNCSQQVHFLLRKGQTSHTSLTEIAPAPSEPGDKLSMDEEAISLLQIKRQLSINEWCINDVLVFITFRNSSVTFHVKYSIFIKKWEV